MSKSKVIAEPGQLDIRVTRTFDAPRALVFKAHTDPNIIAKWWGPSSLTNEVDKFDARPGGQWRIVQKDADGNAYGFHGVFHDVVAPERIVWTFEFEGLPGHVLMETFTLEERDGKTTFSAVSVFQSLEDRDGMLAAGMEGGMEDGFSRLDALLPSMA